MIELEDVRAAAGRIAGAVHRTPVLTSRTLDEATGARVFVKAENQQRGGAFKLRGATNRIEGRSDAGARPRRLRGVVGEPRAGRGHRRAARGAARRRS